MEFALVGTEAASFVFYGLSLVVVLWAIIDVGRRHPAEMPLGRKAAWIGALLVGWLLIGVVGAALAAFYLIGPRRAMNARR